jgi:hypothetical protein
MTEDTGKQPGNQTPNTPDFRESDLTEKERREDPEGVVPGNQTRDTPDVDESKKS